MHLTPIIHPPFSHTPPQFVDDTNVYRVTIHKTFEGNLTCFPVEDHQILTEHGFWYLHQVQAHFARHATLKIACYVDGVLEYHSIGAGDVTVDGGMHDLVEMADMDHSRISLVPTANHRMLLRVGPTDAHGEWQTPQTPPPLMVHNAGSVLQQGAADESVAAQFIARFEHGVAAAEEAEEGTGLHLSLSFVQPLGLQTADEVDAFLQLCMV